MYIGCPLRMGRVKDLEDGGWDRCFFFSPLPVFLGKRGRVGGGRELMLSNYISTQG